MLAGIFDWLGMSAWKTKEQVWAEAAIYDESRQLLWLLFSTSSGFIRDPIFLSRWCWTTSGLDRNLFPARTAAERRLLAWCRTKPVIGRVTHLLNGTDLGFELFGVVLSARQPSTGQPQSDLTHDQIYLLDCQGAQPQITAMLPPEQIALERLATMQRVGSRPAGAFLVQANPGLYQAGTSNAPGLVVFSFDPTCPSELLEQTSQLLQELKTSRPTNPMLQAAAQVVLSHAKQWYYHRRYCLPTGITQGRVIFAADLWIHRPFLAQGRITNEWLPCLIQPGDTGGLELMPHTHVARHFPENVHGMFT